MRRVVALTLVTALVLALGGSVWAAGGPPATAPGAARAEQVRKALEDLRPTMQAMNANRVRIRELSGEIKGTAQQIREEVKRIRQNEPGITEDQLREIKRITGEIRGAGHTISQTMGQIREQAQLAREARIAGDAAPIKGAYSRMLAVQAARIEHLTELLDAMEGVLSQLEALSGP